MTSPQRKLRNNSRADNSAGTDGDLIQRRASRNLRVILLIVPAVAGFLIAYSILQATGPFVNVWEFVAWFLVALTLSFVTSVFVGDFVFEHLTRTRMYEKANCFETTVEELFGTQLRDGSARSIQRRATERGIDAKFIDDVTMLLDQLGRHEKLTRGHSERVRAYASMIGKEMGLKQAELEQLNWAAMLHDVGKLDVPPWILTSPDAPTPDEWDALRRHPESARYRLRRLEKTLGPTIYQPALEHHERWDGQGYPNGLKEGEISLFGRITAVADTFDVITHARSYKQPQTIAEAREELMSAAGTQFDPDVVAAFIRIGSDQLKAVRGWSATVAGVAITGSRLASFGSQLAVTGAVVVGGAVGADAWVTTTIPTAIAAVETTTTTAAPTTVAPTTTTTTTIATTTTTAAPPTTTTTTTIAPRLLTVSYQIGTNEIDGVIVELEAADTLEVFLNGDLHQTIEIEPGVRTVSIVFDVTDLAPGPHPVRFDLYSQGTLISQDHSAIFA